jgi:hypothetical protein
MISLLPKSWLESVYNDRGDSLEGKKLRSKNIVAFGNFYVKLVMSISRQGLSHN